MSTFVEADLAKICTQFEQQGLSIRIMHVDHEARILQLALSFADVECEECVMPADHLERLIADGIRSELEAPYQVRLVDPRRSAHAAAPAAPPSSPLNGKILILDPTATPCHGDLDPGPDAGSIEGRVVGFRIDALWRSWDWVVGEWTPMLEAMGATVRTWKRWQGLPGDAGAAAQAEYDEFLSSVDVLISGMGNCGSCSAWTIRDAITAVSRGIPTMAAVTAQFASLARLLAANGGAAGLRIFEFPYPLDTRPEEEIREIARQMFDSALTRLGVEA
jgi:hypothetical protein